MEKSNTTKSKVYQVLRWIIGLAFIVSAIMSLPFLYFLWYQMSNYWSAWTLIPRTYPNSVMLVDGRDGWRGNCCKLETWIYCTPTSIAEVRAFYETYVGFFHDWSEQNENGERYFAVISGESPRLNHNPPESAKPPMLDIDIYNGHPDCPDGTIYEFTIHYYSE
jgi:hypothetical protein